MTRNVFDVEKIKAFDFEELNGKTLKIMANKNTDGLLVMGLDVETHEFYVLKSEPNIQER